MAEPVIHPSAIVETGAKLADGVKIGPYCIVGAEAALAEGVESLRNTLVFTRRESFMPTGAR